MGLLAHTICMDPRRTGFGERLRDLRKKRGLTQEELAKRADVGRHMTISDYERSKKKSPNIEIVSRIAGVLDTTVDWLLHGDFASAEQTENPALAEFIGSPLAYDVTEAELAALRQLRMPPGVPSPRAYHYALMMLREMK
jgi:transcriptional regulator with XRE-family HTH domain